MNILVEEFALAHQIEPGENAGAIALTDALELRGVSYTYPGSDRAALHDVHLRVRRGESIGIVGGSGAGKSTLADIVLGVLSPSEGGVFVDGRDVRDFVRAWRRTIGYVPQHIFIADQTVRANVAYAMSRTAVDDARVWQALETAQLRDTVAALPQQLDTLLGDRGSRLSGGQRQRIGIARALYHDPAVLVLDEATAALDSETESALSAAMTRLRGQKTLLIIAHRLSTLQQCDRLVVLEEGRLVAEGDFDSLYRSHAAFRRMVELAQVSNAA